LEVKDILQELFLSIAGKPSGESKEG